MMRCGTNAAMASEVKYFDWEGTLAKVVRSPGEGIRGFVVSEDNTRWVPMSPSEILLSGTPVSNPDREALAELLFSDS